MSEQPDQAQRTEEPTQKKLDDARKKGDAPRSQEITATAMLLAGAIGLWLMAGPIAEAVGSSGRVFLEQAHSFSMDGGSLMEVYRVVSLRVAAALGALAALFVAAALLANLVQAKPVFTTEKMKPKLSKLSPLAGAKRILGPSGFVNFGKGIGKITLIGAIFGFALWPERFAVMELAGQSEMAMLEALRGLVLRLLALALGAMVVISGLDYAWQRTSWKKRLRMTKEEVKREQKESEGDPQIKARQRQLRDSRARQRMIVAVQDATVLIMNPTHFAVALKYEDGSASAPVCVAKGTDDLALRLRSVAEEHGVAVVENPPLARALHASVELDQEIPLEHFEAVAKVIGFVMTKSRRPRA